MNLQTFRYAASGGGNVMLGFIIYSLSYTYLFYGRDFNFGFYAFKGHSAALFVSFCVTFPIGFFMSKYVVFSDSKMKGRIQLFRYFMICLFNCPKQKGATSNTIAPVKNIFFIYQACCSL